MYDPGRLTTDENTPTGSATDPVAGDFPETALHATSVLDRRYELTNHLGNVMTVVGDVIDEATLTLPSGKEIAYRRPVINQQQDYLPFGLVYRRSAEFGGGYRYRFNGKEKDDDGEWGSTTAYDYGFRIYDPGIAKFLSVDPLAPDYPELTPYQFASNSPIANVDLDGLESHWHEDVKKTIDKAKKAYEVGNDVVTVIQIARKKVANYQRRLDRTVEESTDPLEVSMALGMEFATGLGPTEREFKEEHAFTQSLIGSRTTRIALERWAQGFEKFSNGERESMPKYYAVSWSNASAQFPFLHTNETGPLREFHEDGGYTASQFTGSAIYYFNYDAEKEVLSITVKDDKNVRSLMFHLVDDKHTREQFPLFGRTYQTYEFALNLDEIERLREVPKPSTDEHHGMGPTAGRSATYPKR